MGLRNYQPKSLLYTSGLAPGTTSSATSTPSATTTSTPADRRPTIPEQECQKRQRTENADVSLADTSSLLHTLRSDVSGGDHGDLTSNPQHNVDARMWIPHLSYCGHQITHDDSLRATPAIGMAMMRVAELPKDKPQIEKDAGDAFVLGIQHM